MKPVWVLCYVAIILNTGQCYEEEGDGDEGYEPKGKYEESTTKVKVHYLGEGKPGTSAYEVERRRHAKERKEYIENSDEEKYGKYCDAEPGNCRNHTLEEIPQEYMEVLGKPSFDGKVNKAILTDMTEEERKYAEYSNKQLNEFVDEHAWSHQPHKKDPPGCGNPICVLIDARPERFKSMCQFVHYLEDNNLHRRMFHIQKGDCLNAIAKKSKNWAWGDKASCSEYSGEDQKYDIPLCLVDIGEKRAHHFDNTCKAMKYLSKREKAQSLYLGIEDRGSPDQCKSLLKNRQVYLKTEWFDIDEPCILGDMESAAQVFHYVHTYPVSESFRFCNSKFKKSTFKIETIHGQSLEDARQQTEKSNKNGGEFVCLNHDNKDKPTSPYYWFHRKITCKDYRIRFYCSCQFGCKPKKKDFKLGDWTISGWNVRVPLIKGPTGRKEPIKHPYQECDWRPFVSLTYPLKDTWDAEIRPHMTHGTKDAPGFKLFRGHACGYGVFDAMYIDARRISDGKAASETNEVITKNTPAYGFLCVNKNQDMGDGQKCSNYKVRFCCKRETPAEWGLWGSWSKCDKTCGGGTMIRKRECTQNRAGQTCLGFGREDMEKQKGECNILPCPGDNEMSWTEWAEWSKCSVTCGPGTKTRMRECKTSSSLKDKSFVEDNCPSKMEQFKKKFDNNLYRETTECDMEACSVPAWGEWSEWSKCSVTCGLGAKYKKRKCQDVLTSKILDLSECATAGTNAEIARDYCQVKENCPVDGGVSQWSAWSTCTISCGDGGKQRRHRDCNDPLPEFGGKECEEFKKIDERECNAKSECPVSCVWSHWGEWTKCDKTCYKATFKKNGRENKQKKLETYGKKERRRHVSQEAKNGGRECDPEQNKEVDVCQEVKTPCPVDCVWRAWGSWDDSMCSDCYDKADFESEEEFLELEMERKRKLETEQIGAGVCLDRNDKKLKRSKARRGETETVKCKDEAKPVCKDGVALWTHWGEWSECEGECGKQGKRYRSRSCVLYPEGYGDEEERIVKCEALIVESKKRGASTDQEYTQCPNLCAHIGGVWGEWGTCSLTCGKGGIQVRPYRCNGAGKDEIDHVVAAEVCGVHQSGNKKGKGILRKKQSRKCDLGECGSRYIPEPEIPYK